ncbi:MAG: glycerol-3-phosphate dehydrogenase/oxidase [Bacteroidota bacterium]
MNTSFASRNRQALLAHLQENQYDLLVIGGGATGSGIALDAASRGLKTALIDKQDFAAGTSSRSTKLIHGGLRYLKQFEIALVREVGRERAIVHKLAPHLVVSEKMLLPIIKDGTYGKLLTSLGLMVYDVLAGVERADQRVMLSRQDALEKEPLIKPEVVEGAGLYAEYRTDDARLSLEVLKTAALYGADSINYVEALDFVYENDVISGATCHDHLTGEDFVIKAHQVVNAAGPWVDTLREKNHSMNEKHLFLSKGVHIVVPHERFPLQQSIYFDVPDGRMCFGIPRGRITYVGTTDTPYEGDINNPLTLEEDVAYLVDGVNNLFPDVNLSKEDVISSWAGLRPLIFEEGKSASEISRKDEIFHSDTNLISIAGGKLTGYRKMAERVVDEVAKYMRKTHGTQLKPCQTASIVITGGGFEDAKDVGVFTDKVLEQIAPHGFDRYDAEYLVHNYGQQTDRIIDAFLEKESKDVRNLILCELAFCLEHEMVQSSMDFFSRRTGRLYFDITSVRDHREAVLNELQAALKWDEARRKQEEEWLENGVYAASNFPEKV